MRGEGIKYSIIIPSFNGLAYLPTCVESVVFQGYASYELILSDDHSTDGTAEYIDSVAGERIRVFHTSKRMSMAEHWEWALGHARGEWLMFVGQDDALQPYFFRLADILTEIAGRKNLRAIASRRAYYYWPGSERFYGGVAVDFSAEAKVTTRSGFFESLSAILGASSYFDLPTMYTTSLFTRGLVDDAKARQGGKVFTTHPQDANLAAIACSADGRYLYSHIPLGWVGSSMKSAGLAVVSDVPGEQEALKKAYVDKTRSSPLRCHADIGDFSIGSLVLYYWGCLRVSSPLRRGRLVYSLFDSRRIKRTVFAAALDELKRSGLAEDSIRMHLLLAAISENGLSYDKVERHRLLTLGREKRLLVRMETLCNLYSWLRRKILHLLKRDEIPPSTRLYRDRCEAPNLTIASASEAVAEILDLDAFFSERHRRVIRD